MKNKNLTNTGSKRYFCSFADKRLRISLKRIGQQATDTAYFDKVYLLNESKLKKNFKNEFSQFLKPDTFYLCAWKPQVIIQMFDKMKDNDILLYADSGCHINKLGLKRLGEYFKIVENSESGILATVFCEGMPEKHWTKGDTFDYFNCRNDKSITETPQIQATTFVIRKSPQTINFVKSWLDIFTKRADLAYRDSFITDNLNGYIDHRSDQSFFSILGKIHKIDLISADEVQGSAAWETEMKDFPIWAKRDKVVDYSLIHNLSWQRVYNAFLNRIKK